MIVTIYESDDRWGSVEYFSEEKKVEVSYPEDAVKQKVIDYLTRVRTLAIQGESYTDYVGPLAPTESMQYMDIALNEMFSRIGVHVWWGTPDQFKIRNVKAYPVTRTVPYDPTQSGEGLLVGEDGSIIYDDTWMHRDVLDDDEGKGGPPK